MEQRLPRTFRLWKSSFDQEDVEGGQVNDVDAQWKWALTHPLQLRNLLPKIDKGQHQLARRQGPPQNRQSKWHFLSWERDLPAARRGRQAASRAKISHRDYIKADKSGVYVPRSTQPQKLKWESGKYLKLLRQEYFKFTFLCNGNRTMRYFRETYWRLAG